MHLVCVDDEPWTRARKRKLKNVYTQLGVIPLLENWEWYDGDICIISPTCYFMCVPRSKSLD
jgi:hypothetical protein